MAGKYKKPCLDSSVFIAGVGEAEICHGIKRGVVFRWLWEKAKSGEFPILISALALAEVFKTRKSAPLGTGQTDEFLELVNEPFVQVIEVDREIGLKAHSLCRQYSANKLYPNDAVHLACALRAGCDFLLAWDTPLESISHPGILIEQPTIYDRTLFTETEIATPEEIKIYEAKVIANAAARAAAGNAAIAAKRHEDADALADRIVMLHKNGTLPSQFTTKDVRKHLTGQFETSQLNKILPNYCADGDQVKRGRKPRFQRVLPGKYVSL